MEKEYLILQKERNFSELLSATFEFLRQEFKYLIKPLLIYALPLSIILGILLGYSSGSLFEGLDTAGDSFDEFPAEIFLIFLTYPFYLIYFLLIYLVIYGYMQEYKSTGHAVPMDRINYRVGRNSLRFLWATILYFLLAFIGTLLLVIPGIFISVSLVFVYAAIIFEGLPATKALRRSYELIKGYWWITFGGILLVGLIVYFLSMILSIPSGIIMFLNMWFSIEESGNSVPLIVSVVSSILASLGYIFSIIPAVFLCFMYFNLVERKEAPGLMERIENIDEGPKEGEA